MNYNNAQSQARIAWDQLMLDFTDMITRMAAVRTGRSFEVGVQSNGYSAHNIHTSHRFDG